MKQIFMLNNEIQKYEWGSKDYIANLLNKNNDKQETWAELWMGAHPKAPSRFADSGQALNIAIQSEPERFLGASIAEKYHNRLPFLFKILSAEKPLSIQAHPTLDQAKLGFEKENRDEIDLTAFNRNYKDENHKPELICALTDFHVMCGFRPAEEIITLFKQSGIDQMLDNFAYFENDLSEDNWRRVLEEILNAKVEKKQQLLKSLEDNIDSIKDRYTGSWLQELVKIYNHDIGVLAPLYLNTFKLSPGQAIFLKAGILHAYLSGTGVEVMANSDNVLRGGLTSKNVDVEELLSILSWDLHKPEVQYHSLEEDEIEYDVPIPEFTLKRFDLDGRKEIILGKPAILIVISGLLSLVTEEDKMELKQGDSVFITSDSNSICFRGESLFYIATTNI